MRAASAGALTVDGVPTYGSVSVGAEPIAITTDSPEPDPDWQFRDALGHFHAYNDKNRLPTLRWVEDETYWCESCRDEHTDGHMECLICREHVTPGVRLPSPTPRYIDGPVTWSAEAALADPHTIRSEVSITVERDGRLWFGVAAVVSVNYDSATGTMASLVGMTELAKGPRVTVSR